jgi:hypothetical protein
VSFSLVQEGIVDLTVKSQNGRYTFDTRTDVCVMDLLDCGIAYDKVSHVIKSVMHMCWLKSGNISSCKFFLLVLLSISIMHILFFNCSISRFLAVASKFCSVRVLSAIPSQYFAFSFNRFHSYLLMFLTFFISCFSIAYEKDSHAIKSVIHMCGLKSRNDVYTKKDYVANCNQRKLSLSHHPTAEFISENEHQTDDCKCWSTFRHETRVSISSNILNVSNCVCAALCAICFNPSKYGLLFSSVVTKDTNVSPCFLICLIVVLLMKKIAMLLKV